METKLTKSITSGYTNNAKLTNQHLDFLDDLVRAQEGFNKKLPYEPMQRNEFDRRFVLELRSREVFDQFLEIKNKLERLYSNISFLRVKLRKEAGQNELVYLEEVTDLFPKNFRISTEIENDYSTLKFNVIFPIKDFPNCFKVIDLMKQHKITTSDQQQVFKGLRKNNYGYAVECLREDLTFMNAQVEIEHLNRLLNPLRLRGFDCCFNVDKISERNLVCRFYLNPDNSNKT